MSYVLLTNDSGYALYENDALVVTWGKKEPRGYVEEQLEARKIDEYTEVHVRNTAFSDKLPTQLKAKIKPKAEPKDEAKVTLQ